MAAKSLAAIYEMLEAGTSVRMPLSKGDADYFRTRLASYKCKMEKILREIDGEFIPKVLSLTYDVEAGIATYQFKETRARSEPKLFEILD